VAIEAAGAAAALQQAIRSVAYGARVIVLGFLQGGAEALRLGEEFHHNRVQLVGSQIGGVASELAGRWDRRRLIATVMELQREGVLDPRPLVSRVVPFERAADAYAWLDRDPEGTLWVLLAGPAAPPWDTRR
jgi:threonine dehydrogenase-like Zn-dependent dehydrogenase